MIAKFRQYYIALGIQGLVLAVLGKLAGKSLLMKVTRSEIKYPIYLRAPSTDVESYHQVFLRREYEFFTDWEPRVILDAGANIGLAAVYFANCYPNAKIIAVEPEESNLQVLYRNIKPYANITCVPGALWDKNEAIDLIDLGLGKWGFMTRARGDAGLTGGRLVHQVRGMTIDAIMAEQGVECIDILKLDVEGAEHEIFRDSRAWIERTEAVIVELHDRLKPGCTDIFSAATAGFDFTWRQGENVCAARKTGCLVPNLRR